MALLDRFRRPPQWKHEDPLARIAGVEELPLDQQELLISIARGDGDARVRRAAVRKIIDPAAVAEVARTDRDESVRDEATGILRDLALGVFENTAEAESLAALGLLTDVRDVITVAESASLEPVWRAAIARLDDPKALGTVARRASLPAARLDALVRLQDPAELCAVAVKSEHKDVALAAVERISDREALKLIAAKAVAKAAGRRARTLLDELEARERPAASAPEVLVAQAARTRRLDLCRQVEALAKASGSSVEIAARIAQAEAAWTQLTPELDAELAERFGAGCTAARERLARVSAEEADRSRIDAEVAAAVAARAAMCGNVEAIDGDDALARLEEACAAWRELPPLPPGHDVRAQELARRFDEAVAACKRRHARLLAARAMRARAQQVCDDADHLVAGARFPEALQQWASLARAWKELSASGFADDELNVRFKQAEERFGAREAAAREQQARLRQGNLERLQRHAERVERMLANTALSMKDAERGLRDVRAALDDMPALPHKNDQDEMSRRFKALHAALIPRVQELREIDEWQRWANAGIQEQLCRRAEALRDVVDVADVAQQLREIQEEWKQASLVPREKAQALWGRFRVAADEARARCETYFAQQAESRAANLARKETLCQQAQALSESSDWIRTAEAIMAMQAEWKGIGPVPRGAERAVWERFRQACDRFFTRRHEDLARRKEEWAANLAKKQELCERVEALSESIEWDKGIEEVKRAQAEWKAIGPVRKNRAEAVWQRFRGACELFLERYRERDNLKLAGERAEREALCAELEALAPMAAESEAVPPSSGEAVGDLAGRVVTIRARWLELERADSPGRASWAPLNERFARALDRVIEQNGPSFANSPLDPDAARRVMIELCEKVEGLVATGRPTTPAGASPAAVLAEQLREALAANTIGGRATGAEVEAKWRAAEEQVRVAKVGWAALSPVPGESGRALARRFNQACQRVAQQRERELRALTPSGVAPSPRRAPAPAPRRSR